MKLTPSLLPEITSKAPDKAIVLFDGVCNLCNGAVDFIIKRDPDNYFLFASLQSDIGQAALKALNKSTNELDSILLIQQGKILEKSSAALAIARRLSGFWPVLGIFRFLPKALRDPIYTLIANNRYAWFGKKETCRLPSPEERARFLES